MSSEELAAARTARRGTELNAFVGLDLDCGYAGDNRQRAVMDCKDREPHWYTAFE